MNIPDIRQGRSPLSPVEIGRLLVLLTSAPLNYVQTVSADKGLEDETRAAAQTTPKKLMQKPFDQWGREPIEVP